MTHGAFWLASLGSAAALRFWEPVLLWTGVALVALAGLRLLGRLHPAVQERARTAILLALPLGVLLASASRAGWLPRQPIPLLIPSAFSAASGAAMAVTDGRIAFSAEALPPGDGDLARTGGVDDHTPLPAMVVLGAITLLAALASLGVALRLTVDRIALLRLRRGLRFPEPHEVLCRCAPGDRPGVDLALTNAPSGTRLAVSGGDMIPLTFGVARPVVALPEALLDDPIGLRLALEHELAHVRRRDALFHTVEEWTAIVFAVHPLVHALRRETRRFRELACDAEVLARSRGHRRAYAALLLRWSDPTRADLAPVGMHSTFEHLKERITLMHTSRFDSGDLKRSRRHAAALAGLLFAIAAGATSCTDLITEPTQGESVTEAEVVTFDAGAYEPFLRAAREDHGGRILVYFSGRDEAVGRRIESLLWENPDYAGPINASFARYTVMVDSPEALDLMARYNVTSHVVTPLLMVVNEADRATLMTTLSEADTPQRAAAKVRQILESVGLN